MTACLLDQPVSTAWPTAHDWLTGFLREAGDRGDRGTAIAMTSDAVATALAHADRPVRLIASHEGAKAQIKLHAHSPQLPQTQWTAGSPIVEQALPRLRRRTRHCGAAVQLTPAGAETMLWFRLPTAATWISRVWR